MTMELPHQCWSANLCTCFIWEKNKPCVDWIIVQNICYHSPHRDTFPLHWPDACYRLVKAVKSDGAGSVMTTGTCMKPRWCASNWAVGLPWQPQWRPTLGQGKASFCWRMCTVQEERVFWDSVPMPTGTSVTVVLQKTPVSSALVTVTSPSKDAHPIIQTASPLTPPAELALVCSAAGSVCVHVFGFFIIYFLFLFFSLFDLPLFCSISWVFGLECHEIMCVDHLWPLVGAQSQEEVVRWGTQLEHRNFLANRCWNGF